MGFVIEDGSVGVLHKPHPNHYSIAKVNSKVEGLKLFLFSYLTVYLRRDGCVTQSLYKSKKLIFKVRVNIV